jgi:hypothetical protein
MKLEESLPSESITGFPACQECPRLQPIPYYIERLGCRESNLDPMFPCSLQNMPRILEGCSEDTANHDLKRDMAFSFLVSDP